MRKYAVNRRSTESIRREESCNSGIFISYSNNNMKETAQSSYSLQQDNNIVYMECYFSERKDWLIARGHCR